MTMYLQEYFVILTCMLAVVLSDTNLFHSKKLDTLLHQELNGIDHANPQHCQRAEHVYILGSLPGNGWDNLRNLAMSPVVSLNYSKCRLTSDDKFIIPNDVDVQPIKQSRIQLYSKIISEFTNYTDPTSQSLNMNAKLKVEIFKASGTFSNDYQSAKMRVTNDNTKIMRSGIRLRQYNARTVDNAQLHPIFLDRILDIVSCIQSNDTDSARYLSEVLIRDYGTHIIQSTDVGALLIQEEYIRSRYVDESNSQSTDIRAIASGKFWGLFEASLAYTSTATKEQLANYSQNIKYKETKAFGGPSIKLNFDIDSWIDDIDNHLVAIDRKGVLLHHVITAGSLPQLAILDICRTSDFIEDAIINYYTQNTYLGCTRIDSPNFNYNANVDDGSCTSPLHKYRFGGFYQTCYNPKKCYSSVKHPKTQTYSCPTDYISKVLFTADSNDRIYWCVATKQLSSNSGYMFGGIYTTNKVNPLTNDKNCPKHFREMAMGMDTGMFVCVSDDYELGFSYSVPFGGLFSCQAGNALASGFSDEKSSSFKKCPEGYSQELIGIISTCEFHYCVQSLSRTANALPKIKLPPFEAEPRLLTTESRVVIGSTDKWVKPVGQTTWYKMHHENSHRSTYAPSRDNFMATTSTSTTGTTETYTTDSYEVANPSNETYTIGNHDVNSSNEVYTTGNNEVNSSNKTFTNGNNEVNSFNKTFTNGNNEVNSSNKTFINGNREVNSSNKTFTNGNNKVNSSNKTFTNVNNKVNSSNKTFSNGNNVVNSLKETYTIDYNGVNSFNGTYAFDINEAVNSAQQYVSVTVLVSIIAIFIFIVIIIGVLFLVKRIIKQKSKNGERRPLISRSLTQWPRAVIANRDAYSRV